MSLPRTTKGWAVVGQGRFDNLKFDTKQPLPELSDNEVLVKFHAASLNFRNIMIAQGTYPFDVKENIIPGSDGAGEVVDIGKKVTRFQKGSEVTTLFMQTNLNYLEAATLPCSALTAWNALYGLKAVLPGDWVLTQGTGSVSISALQFAKAAGARVVATTSSAAKAQRLRDLGADHVINYKEIPNWGEEAKRLTEGGVDHVLEVGGAHTITESLKAVNIGGSVTIIGWIARLGETGLSFPQILSSMAVVRGIVVPAIQAFDIKPVFDKQVSKLKELKDAYQYLVDQKHFSKVVIKIG
ncbi:alcohol dehydrogenase [Fusarium pseudoanthophilum]|uniref:Alcohol dehydrogenase n=1 Tax=Fusarium pseudoanthophilum TaxID=48495 RepID=A0A8H5PN99_9HYPO|nr:alcohol dehydrogenase [Fusarium pseudoanthophilum]